MVRGNYPMQDPEGSKAQKDTSFKKCLITMFIMFLLCIIIILIFWQTKTDSSDKYSEDTAKQSGNKLDAYVNEPPVPVFSSKPTTKPPVFTTTRQADLTADSTTAKDNVTRETETSSPVTVSTVNQIKQGTKIYKNITIHTTDTTPVTQPINLTLVNLSFSSESTAGEVVTTDNVISQNVSSVLTTKFSDLNAAGTTLFGITTDSSKNVATPNITVETSTIVTDVTTASNDTDPASNITTVTAGITANLSVTETTLLGITTDSSKNVAIPNITVETSTIVTDVTTASSDTDPASNITTVTAGVGITANLSVTETTLLGITTDSSKTTSSVTMPNITSEETSTTVIVITDSATTRSSPITSDNTVPMSAITRITTDVTSKGTASTVSESQTTQLPNTPPIGTLSIDKGNETCQKSECKVLASRMLSLMNHSVDPCDNFYEFACGGLRDNYALLQENPEQDIWNRIAYAVEEVNISSSLVYQKFRYFYDQCVDYEHNINQNIRLELAQKVVGEVDNIYNTSEWVEADKTFNFTNLLIKLFSLDSAPLFDMSLDVNPHNISNFQLKLTVPRSHSKLQLESPSASHCKSHIKSDDPHNIDMKLIYERKYLTCLQNYTKYFTTLKTAVLDLKMFGETDADEVTQQIGNISSFIKSDIFSPFQEIDPWRIKVDTMEKKFATKTVEELQTNYSRIDWEILIGTLFNITIYSDTKVQVYFENYFGKLFDRLEEILSNSTGRSLVHNGLLAMLAHDIYVDLVKPRPCNREEYCLKTASVLMEDVSSSLYISTFTSEELSDKGHKLVTLFHQLRNILSEEINKISLLNPEARNNMLDKLGNMTVVVHDSKNILFDADSLNSSFLNNINFTNNHFENAVQLIRQSRKTLYQHIELNTSAPGALLLFSLPIDTHPIFVYELNTIILPFGMVGSWKHTNELPEFVFEARVGNEIARQIVHHFDTTGINYSATGRDDDFLKGQSHVLYVENYIKCEEGFHNDNFTWISQRNQTYFYQVNAARTMNEHFTDNSALWLTHKLFNKTEPVLPWLEKSHDELYLLLAAQEFCVKAELLDYTVTMFETEHFAPHLRVKNLIESSTIFRDVYKCQLRTTNNTSRKCAPFPQLDVNLLL